MDVVIFVFFVTYVLLPSSDSYFLARRIFKKSALYLEQQLRKSCFLPYLLQQRDGRTDERSYFSFTTKNFSGVSLGLLRCCAEPIFINSYVIKYVIISRDGESEIRIRPTFWTLKNSSPQFKLRIRIDIITTLLAFF